MSCVDPLILNFQKTAVIKKTDVFYLKEVLSIPELDIFPLSLLWVLYFMV